MTNYRNLLMWGMTATLLIGLVGCSGKSTEESTTADESGTAKADDGHGVATATEIVLESPQQIVTGFLVALKQGDRDVVESLISPIARQEMPKYNLKVEPLGTPDAEFEIGKVEFPENRQGTSYVPCIWKEPTADGSFSSSEVVWVMKQQSDRQWRIAGMAMEGPNQEVVFFNFEKPQDMLAQRDALAASYENAQSDVAPSPTDQPATGPADRTAKRPSDVDTERR